jgi:hypothetical protein
MDTRALIQELEDLLQTLGPETRKAWAGEFCCAVAGRCAGSYGCSVQCAEDPSQLECNDQTCEDFPGEPECVTSVPAIGPTGLVALAAGLGGLAYRAIRRRTNAAESEDEGS